MNLFLALLFILFAFFVGIIPFFILYVFSDIMRFILFRIAGYRKDVIIQNLENSAINDEKADLKKLISAIYKNLTDLIIEGIKGFSMTRNQIVKRHKIMNPELLKPFYDARRSVIAVTGHYGNWEWGSMSAALQLEHRIIGLYKPLTNPWVDRFMKWTRTRSGTTLASIYETSKTFETFKCKPCIYLMAADQSPSHARKAIWVNFLERETAFLYGPEKYATDYNLPVIYVDIQRVRRGYYEIELSVLTGNPRETKPTEITALFAERLDNSIRNKPENWLWSHRRWKLNR
jgi:KDO2-lipid IV(A) lauroyltransferase